MKLIYALFASSILFASLPTLGPHAADDGTAKPGQLSHLEMLGKNLFEDTSLSEPPGQACASCHDPRLSFTGNAKSPVAAVAVGSRVDQLGARNVPTIMYMAFSPPFRFVEERGVTGKGNTRRRAAHSGMGELRASPNRPKARCSTRRK